MKNGVVLAYRHVGTSAWIPYAWFADWLDGCNVVEQRAQDEGAVHWIAVAVSTGKVLRDYRVMHVAAH